MERRSERERLKIGRTSVSIDHIFTQSIAVQLTSNQHNVCGIRPSTLGWVKRRVPMGKPSLWQDTHPEAISRAASRFKQDVVSARSQLRSARSSMA